MVMKIYKYLLLSIVVGIITPEISGAESSSKLKDRLYEFFDPIQLTTNKLLLTPKQGTCRWGIAPLLSTNYKTCSPNDVISISLEKNYGLVGSVGFTFVALDPSFGEGFFIICSRPDKRYQKLTFGSIVRKPKSKSLNDYIIIDGKGIPVEVWNYAKDSGLLEMYKSQADTPIYPPPSLTNQVVQEKEPHSKNTPIKEVIPKKSELKKTEKGESSPELSIPKEPITEQPSQITPPFALPISIGGFLVLLGGWFFWKKGR
jgi:hypothetical protein